MQYNFSNLKEGGKKVEDWLSKEFSGIRTGRAMPAILDTVLVESYGAKMPIKELASISIEDSRTLRITPWDGSQTKNIEKAIAVSSLGLGISIDEKGLRVIFPELTAERRGSLLKVAGEKLEQAKVTLRAERDEVWQDIQKKEKEGAIGEDEKFRLKSEMQKIVDEAGKKLEEQYARKEKEVRG